MAENCRVIVHLDLDAFYAQVEAVRRDIPADVPLAVLQWESLIAVSYAAQRHGVRRFGSLEEAIRACPDMLLVHVDTVEQAPSGGDANEHIHTRTYAPVRAEHWHTQLRHKLSNPGKMKVSLKMYRESSMKVMDFLQAQFHPSDRVVFERASIDEVFLDVTHLARTRLSALLASGKDKNSTLLELYANIHLSHLGGSHVPRLADGQESEQDKLLLVGAMISDELRRAVKRELRFAMSGGISSNKALAKLASPMNKPDAQTLVLHAHVPELMVRSKVKKIRNLGGKLGSTLTAAGFETAADAQTLSAPELAEILGSDMSTAHVVYNLVRGIDPSECTPKDEKPKSMLAAKNLPGAARERVEDVAVWLHVLVAEMAERVAGDAQRNNRMPKTLKVSFRSNRVTTTRQVSWPGDALSHDALFQTAVNILRDSSQLALPCGFIGLTACNFVDRARGVQKMELFLSDTATEKKTQPAGCAGIAKERDTEEVDSQNRTAAPLVGAARLSRRRDSEIRSRSVCSVPLSEERYPTNDESVGVCDKPEAGHETGAAAVIAGAVHVEGQEGERHDMGMTAEQEALLRQEVEWKDDTDATLARKLYAEEERRMRIVRTQRKLLRKRSRGEGDGKSRPPPVISGTKTKSHSAGCQSGDVWEQLARRGIKRSAKEMETMK